MLSLLSWLGVALLTAGAWRCVRRRGRRRSGATLALAGLALAAGPLLWFAYGERLDVATLPEPDGAAERPTAFVLAFEDDTPADLRTAGHLRPGAANRALADWVRGHAGAFARVLTQESVLWALWHPADDYDPAAGVAPPADGARLAGTPVYRMHAHDPAVAVRTLPALACALYRFRDDPPPAVALVCHDRQFERARADLRSLYRGRILGPFLSGVPARNAGRCQPLLWAARELLLARPAEALWRGHVCPPAAALLPPLPPAAQP